MAGSCHLCADGEFGRTVAVLSGRASAAEQAALEKPFGTLGWPSAMRPVITAREHLDSLSIVAVTDPDKKFQFGIWALFRE
jgi:hypothetical protein